MTTLILRGMQGLGDTIYERPFLRAANARGERIHLVTSWPQLLADLPNIIPVHERTILRTQGKNIARSAGLYQPMPRHPRAIVWNYCTQVRCTVFQALEKRMPLKGQPLVMDLPDFGPAPVQTGRPYILVRPCTVRREWRADNRNCLPEYLVRAVAVLRGRYDVVSVADLADGHEWAIEPMPEADQTFHAGELQVEQLMALVANATAVVAPLGWALPAAMAYRRPAFFILGGQGLHNSPQRLTDPRLDTSQIHFAMPDSFCRCGTATHPCDRRISNLEKQLEDWRSRTGV